MGLEPSVFLRTECLSWGLWDTREQRVCMSDFGFYKAPIEDLMLLSISISVRGPLTGFRWIFMKFTKTAYAKHKFYVLYSTMHKHSLLNECPIYSAQL